jgi:hypothetical protein
MRRVVFNVRFLSVVAFAMLAGMWPVVAQASGGGGAADFSVLADSTGLTCTGSTVDGPVGVKSGTPVTVTPPNCDFPVVLDADGAYADFLNIYSGIASNLTPCHKLSGTLAGISLAPGVYCFDSYAALTGTLTLTGTGPWLFEIGTSGTGYLEATNFNVVSDNPCNAFWWVRQYATIKTSTFQGTILGGTDMTFTGTNLDGRAWATGAVTMTDSSIFGCAGAGTVTGQHQKCNQGVGNGPEGCDPGNSNQGNPANSNDENGGTPGNPGRRGGNHTAVSVANGNFTTAVAARGTSNHATAPATSQKPAVAGRANLRAMRLAGA